MPSSNASTGTVNVCAPSASSTYGIYSDSSAATASSPVPIYRYRYPFPPIVITAVILPSATVSLQAVILNIEELESTTMSYSPSATFSAGIGTIQSSTTSLADARSEPVAICASASVACSVVTASVVVAAVVSCVVVSFFPHPASRQASTTPAARPTFHFFTIDSSRLFYYLFNLSIAACACFTKIS